MMVTRFERLTRRISLSGMLTGHRAEEAIKDGRVTVGDQVATSNFKVFSEAVVKVDGVEVPPPFGRPRLWGMFKPRKVLCQATEKEGTETLKSRMRRWREKETTQLGAAMTQGLSRESLEDRHFVVVCGLSYNADGLVLMTNDGQFKDVLMSPESRILSAFDVKISGDPPVDLLHKWRKGARARGINYGPVYASVENRSAAATRLRIRYVESANTPIEVLLDEAKMRVNRLRRYAFGPYIVTALPQDRVVELDIHKSLESCIPVADMRQALIPVHGHQLDSEGKIRSMGLSTSSILRREESS